MIQQNLTVVPYAPHYAEALQQICLETGHSLTANEAQKSYLLSMYCDCYLEQGHAFVLLDELQQPQGYILYAEDGLSHIQQMQPYLEKISALDNPLYPMMAQAELNSYESYAAQYPAHLHVDIREPYTGIGGGTLLMNTLVAHLQSKGIPGLMLMVAASNERAIAYYRKYGFETLAENPHALTLGRILS